MDYEAFYRALRQPGFIPGYEILQKIGAGVFGEVFKARKESIGRIYVIKFLKLDGEAHRVVIEKELASLHNFAQIDHPNLVGIEDQGFVHGIPYIIMSFGGDATLQDRLSAGVMAAARRNSAFHQILSGVEAIHRRNIVHFDLKPANIFVRDETVRVGDYGLAKLLSESRQSLSFGRGTPYYMAPEVMRRKGDLRSDVYSLGAMLFELVTGSVPFDGDSDWEVLKQHEVDPIPFPVSFPPALRTVVETAMAKAPDRRYPSAAEMRMAFLAAVGGELSESHLPESHLPESDLPESDLPATDASGPSPVTAVPDPAAERVGRLAAEVASRFREHARHASTAGQVSPEPD